MREDARVGAHRPCTSTRPDRRAALGHVIENAVVQWALEQADRPLPNVEWHRAAELEGLVADDGGAVAVLPGRRLRAPLVVGADGADSRVRALTGIDAVAGDYDQRAVVAEVRTAAPHGETAWQRFLPGGPLAFLPLANGASSHRVVDHTRACRAPARARRRRIRRRGGRRLRMEARRGDRAERTSVVSAAPPPTPANTSATASRSPATPRTSCIRSRVRA